MIMLLNLSGLNETQFDLTCNCAEAYFHTPYQDCSSNTYEDCSSNNKRGRSKYIQTKRC